MSDDFVQEFQEFEERFGKLKKGDLVEWLVRDYMDSVKSQKGDNNG